MLLDPLADRVEQLGQLGEAPRYVAEVSAPQSRMRLELAPDLQPQVPPHLVEARERTIAWNDGQAPPPGARLLA